MIVGKGLIASAFAGFDHSGLLLFASGVSDSGSRDAAACARERELLLRYLHEFPQHLFVYFSTYSVNDPVTSQSFYVQHKLQMEALISRHHRHYLVVRTGNITGHTGNPATLMNFFHAGIRSGRLFDCWKNASRNLLDAEHLAQMVYQLYREKRGGETVYLVNPVYYNAAEIVQAFEKVLGLKAACNMLEKGVHFEVDTVESKRLFNLLDIPTEGYLETLIKKYYSHEG